MDIWELASQVDKDIPEDIWDIVGMFLLVIQLLLLKLLLESDMPFFNLEAFINISFIVLIAN